MALPQTHWIRMLNPWVIHTFKLLSRCLINLLKVLILNKFHFFTLIENLPPAILKKLQVKWKLLSRVWLFVTPWTIQSMDSPGQNTGVGNLSLLQGIFPTQGSNPGLLHYRWILHQLSHQGSPRILEWVAYPFSSRSSQPRNRTGVSCIASGFFINWTMREAHEKWAKYVIAFLPSSLLISWLQSRRN